jgi:hypothetical protein
MNIAGKMNGQWIGTYTSGDVTGRIHINIDELESNYFGTAYVFSNDPKLPTTVAYFLTTNKDRDFTFSTDNLKTIHPHSAEEKPWEEVKDLYPGATFSKNVDVQGSVNRDSLTLSWTTDIGLSGSCSLPRSKADQPSELASDERDWGGFKTFALEQAPSQARLFFRGQRKQWRLRTPFHRSGRANMWRYVFNDIPALHKNLSARTKHFFKLDQQDEFGAFISLIQHHGYPTPVLDWTSSPYVAAYFAYRGITNEEAENAPVDAKVRILVFDAQTWIQRYEAITHLVHPKLYVTVRDFIAIENERIVPQQASSTVTSVDDVETFIITRDAERKYLRAIDLPVRERKHVMRELRYMGITAGSLFPGLDGGCEDLRERNFEYFPSVSDGANASERL